MSNFIDAYKTLMETLIGDDGVLRKVMDDLGFPEEQQISEPPVDNEEPISLDEDGEDVDDMYLTRIGYLKEEKPKARLAPLDIREAFVTSPPDELTNFVERNPWGQRTLNRPPVSSSSYTSVEWTREYQNNFDGRSPMYIAHHHHTAGSSVQDHYMAERSMYELYERIVHTAHHNASFGQNILNRILMEAKNQGIIDRFYTDIDNLQDRIRISMDKGEYRQGFYINFEQIGWGCRNIEIDEVPF